jgi:hypothetical protein
VILRHDPGPLIAGEQFRDLRRLWRERQDSAAALFAWQEAWAARYTQWRRKRAYDGLHEVLSALSRHAGLSRPSFYRHTDVADWCRTVQMIAELRNDVVHGAAVVSEKLAGLSNGPTSLTFDFVEASSST